jgi:alpha-beta hydrolase superfamily lysophospholipase
MSAPGNESTLTTFTASDGDNLAVQDWLLPEDVQPRATVLVVHGLGEHAGRHDPLAQRLNEWGFAVRSYDQYGHGESGGVRGGLPQSGRLVDDLADIVESTRSRTPELPLVLLGHSLGGLVAAGFVARERLRVDALVLSSPSLALRTTAVQRLLLNVVPRLAPNVTVGNGLDPAHLSHDPAVVAAYRRDPRVHDRISGRLGRYIADEAQLVRSRASQWTVPTLLLYAGDDRLVDPAGSRDFAERAPKEVVTAQCFPTLWHEIFNEVDAGPVFAALRQWLDARF